ncbi:MAG TPA: hypothetical protein VMF52_12690 [Steroidobacteraceae bacterium]|nr:hypothetical protein [Steroidobacteraceae bacterium]
MKSVKWALPLVATAFFGMTAQAATTAAVTKDDWDLYRQDTNVKVGTYTSETNCVNAAKAINANRSYTCRTRTEVQITVTGSGGGTTCPSRPADEKRTQSCPSGTTGTWQQSRTYTSAAYPTCWTAGAWTPTSAPSGYCVADGSDPDPTPPPTTGTWTDLASAPSCAKVTVYPAKTVTTPAGAGIPTHTGRCLEATTSTIASVWQSVQPGDVVYLRAGTYTGQYGEGSWYGNSNFETYKKGTASQPIAVVAYPGENVVLKPSGRPALIFGDGTRNSNHAEYLTFAGMSIIASYTCASGGGDTTDSGGGPTETGGKYIRLVGIDCTITDATSNTMTGLIDLQNDGWKILGSAFHDPSNRVVINNNHVIYIQGGADDVEVGYNKFVGLHTGHVVQIHQDGTPKQHDRVSVHDNLFQGVNYGDMRGISVVNIADASTISVTNNTFRHQGQGGWGCMNFYRGNITVSGNDCADSQGGLNLNGGYGGTRKVTASNNKICPVSGYTRIGIEGGASSSQITETGAKSCSN